MAQLHFGVRIPSGLAPDVGELLRFVQGAEGLGFESVWAGDHVFHQTDVLAPLDLLSWAAANTTKVRLGTSVLLAAYLNPVLLAKSAATVDYLSGGRLTLGVSLGGSPAEYASLGVPMKQRLGRLLESTALMRRLWTEDDVQHIGRYFTVTDGNLRPKPKQQNGIPVWFAAREDAMLDRIPAIADGWIASSHYPLAAFLRGVNRIAAAAEVASREPGSVAIAKVHDVSIHADHEEARHRANAHWRRYYGPSHDIATSTTFGTPDEVAAQLAAYAGAACDELLLILEPTSLAADELKLLHEAAAAASERASCPA